MIGPTIVKNTSVGFVIALFILMAPFVFADSITLNDGSVLRGRIVEERGSRISMITGNNMVIHVEKENVQSIHRVKRAAPAPVIIKSDVIAATTDAPLVISKSASHKVGGVVAQQTWVFQPQVNEALSWTGVSHKKNNDVAWKSALIMSTAAVRADYWVAFSSAVVRDPKLRQEEEGLQKIHFQFLTDFAEALQNVHAATEPELQEKSEDIFQELKKRADNRRRGFERRFKKP